ncbi:hypothetical protein RIF29_15100 [Crotalaria pallida]|uniref:FAR1 domain-containing protein n=1 Tax=Crotalaria pallida TaxID=3830 RepID=A0AAN9IEC5_CROPI
MDFEKGVTEFETCEEEPQSSIPTDPSNPNIEPFVGMEFDSEPSARIFYNSYARRAGFSIRAHKCQRARRDGSLVGRQIVCSREGFRREMKDGRGPTRQHSVTRVAAAKKLGPGLPQNVSDNDIHEIQPGTTDEDKKIQELTTELESATQRCEAYRQNLVGLLKIMDEQKLKVSVEVHNFRLNLQAESVNLNDS